MSNRPISRTARRVWGARVPYLAVILALLLAPLPVRANEEPPRAYPALLQMANDRPTETVRVIVQRYAGRNLPAQALAQMGGGRIKDLPIINGFAMELPARAVQALARNPNVRWVSLDAPIISSSGFGTYTYRDEFSTISFGGSNGTQNWNPNKWVEIGESDGTGSGRVRVVSHANCTAGNCLRIGGDDSSISGRGVYRLADLSGATAATLTFSYRRQASGSASVALQVSADGGTWVPLATYSLSGSDGGQVPQTFDLTAFAGSNTQIRFLGAGSAGGYLYVDNLQIAYSRLANAYVRSVQADRWWKELTIDPGQGVTVAIVDSGIAAHGDLLDLSGGTRLLASVNFSSQSADASDQYGHGTHVAGIAGGLGAASAGARIGAAPLINLINVKVTGANGSGFMSDLVNSLQWIYNNRATYNIRVVNLSLNSTVPEPYHTSPLSAAVEILWFNGVVVVVSAGNNGTGVGPVTLYPPANDPFVITVGATDDMGTAGLADDGVASFSAYGLTENGFAKPDLVAPGRNLISLLASTNATVYVQHPAHRVDGNYFRMSGTSMAAPVVTGAAALLLQDEPNLTPDQVKFRLLATANKNWTSYDPVRAGAGTVDVYAAVLGTTTQSANTGLQASQMLWTGSDPVTWNSVNWNSVNWNSVNWNSVNWNSVNWNSVNWNSVNWNSAVWDD